MMWNAVSSKAQPPNLGLTQDPFRGGENILVMADAYEPPRDIDGKHIDMKPIPTNTRHSCMEAMEKVMDEEPWFGIEQVCRKSYMPSLPDVQAMRITHKHPYLHKVCAVQTLHAYAFLSSWPHSQLAPERS